MKLLDDAIIFAVKAHSGTVRKNSGVPYILHPLEAAVIAASLTGDEEVMAAAVLHDTVEDTEASAEDIRARFGARVAALVAAETEDKRPGQPAADTWRLRKEESLRELAEAEDPGVKILWLADKLSNMRGLYRSWQKDGSAIWERFNQNDPAEQAWYYRSVTKLLAELGKSEAWQELNDLVEKVFEGIR